MTEPLPSDPPELLSLTLARASERLTELIGSGLSQDGLYELWQLSRAIAAPLAQPDVRSRWREFYSERDLDAIAQLTQQLHAEVGQYTPETSRDALLRQLLEQLTEQIEWCLEGLGVESDLRVLSDRLAETTSVEMRRELRIAERIADVIDELGSATSQRLNQAVNVRPTGTQQERRRLLETLATLQTGLVEIINSSASAADALRLYVSALAQVVAEQNQAGVTRSPEEVITGSALYRHNRFAFKRALARVLRALDQPLPPLPPGLQQHLGHDIPASFGTL